MVRTRERFHINAENKPNNVPVYTPKHAASRNSRYKLLKYSANKDGSIISKSTNKKLTIRKKEFKAIVFRLHYEDAKIKKQKLTVPCAELIITSFYKDKGLPFQILYKNGDPNVISLENLIPLYSLEETQEYWICRLSETEGEVKIADFGQECQQIKEYLITANGRVFSTITQSWLVPKLQADYYLIFISRIGKSSDGKTLKGKSFRLHRVVCQTFNGNPPDNLHVHVDHIDRNSKNNHKNNLKWVTVSENMNNRNQLILGPRPQLKTSADQVWKSVGVYFDSDYSVYKVSSCGQMKDKNGEIMRETISSDGYIYNSLKCQSTRTTSLVNRHRLVAWAFNRVNYNSTNNVVDHINGIKNDNRPENLRWVSQQENLEAGIGVGIELHQDGKVVDKQNSIKKFQEKYKLHFRNICYKLEQFQEYKEVSRIDKKKHIR